MRLEPYSPTRIPYSRSDSISSSHTSALGSLSILSSSLSPSSGHTNEANGNLSSFQEFKMYLPSLEFSAWLFSHLSLALSHKLIQVWPIGFVSCARSGWVWLIRGRSQSPLIETVRKMLWQMSSIFHGFSSKKLGFWAVSTLSELAPKYLRE